METMTKPMSIQQLSDASGYSYALIRSWVGRDVNALPSIRSGKRWWVYEADFLDFIEREKRRR